MAIMEINFREISPDDVGKMDRNALLSILQGIRRLTETLDEYVNQIIRANAEIEGAKKHAEEMRNAVSGWVNGITFITVFVLSIYLFFGGLSWFGPILSIAAGLMALKPGLLLPIDKLMNSKKREMEANNYLEITLPPLQEQIVAAQQSLVDIQKSEESTWAMDVIGKELFNSACVEMLMDIVKSRRADNLKEALNKYDSSAHTNKMEEMQRAIQNASEIAAEESAKQTVYAEETAKNTHQAATAAKATAHHTRQVSKAIRKSLK